jgi:hypothetical protein
VNALHRNVAAQMLAIMRTMRDVAGHPKTYFSDFSPAVVAAPAP